ncbi:MAG: metallophosphoesterase [Planctomycetota bacterium]|nr:metallophosphoesterase [Planctomycetota bacterium]
MKDPAPKSIKPESAAGHGPPAGHELPAGNGPPAINGRPPSKWTRRRFLKIAAGGVAALGLGLGYSAAEAGWMTVAPDTIAVPRLPAVFRGFKLAFLTDLHHGPYTGLDYLRQAVAATNALAPDVICLGGDYVHQDGKFIRPCFDVLAALRAPMGVFGVMGNHDAWEGLPESRAAMQAAGIRELTNAGVWLDRGGARVRLCGVGDLWTDEVDLPAALDDATPADACVVLSHNPDVAEDVRDARVSLMLSGHTHGGQVVLPVFGAPFTPSRYGQKYLSGLCRAPATQVFVSRGLGTITPPLRFGCRPEINLLTLT